jgi:integrase
VTKNRTTLTEVALRAMHGSAGRRLTVWDAVVKHFGVRITPNGVKTFIVLLGSGRRQSIGHYPVLSLAQARDKAKRILAERALGRHQISSISWNAAVQKFIDACTTRTRPRTHAEYQRGLARYFPFGTTRLSEIGKRDISRKLEALAKTPSQQAHALVICKMLFRWALVQGYIEVDPTAAFKRTRQCKRTRVLSDREVQQIWHTCDRCIADAFASNGTPAMFYFATIVKLLILSGQRRGEIATLEMSFFTDDLCVLPASLTKNGREHRFPISTLFGELVASARARSAASSFIFPARSRAPKPFNSWSNSKTALDEMCGVKDWTLHDLRRTFRTMHARIGTPPHIAERLINHVNGVASDVELIYDLHTYLPEMRKAVAAYETHLGTLFGRAVSPLDWAA